nr:hypothetical protein [uncultured Blautia sp.]
MKGKRKLTQRILSLLMVFAMVMGMLLEPVQIYAAQPGEDAGQMKAGPADPQPDGNGGTTDQGGTPGGDGGETTPQDTTKITLDLTSLNLVEGETKEIIIVNLPETAQDISWVSGNTDTATVTAHSDDNSKATVTAVNAGTTTITATVDGQTATANVAVSAKTYEVSGTVTSASNNQAISGITVSVNGQDVTTEENGTYTVMLPEGTHNATFTGTGFVDKTATIIVDANGDVSNADVQMSLKPVSVTMSSSEIYVGGTTTATVNGELQDYDIVSWASSDLVTTNGTTITGKKAGKFNGAPTVQSKKYGSVVVNSTTEVTVVESPTDVLVTAAISDDKKKMNLSAQVTSSKNDTHPTSGIVTFTIARKDGLPFGKTFTAELNDKGIAEVTAEKHIGKFRSNYIVTATYGGQEGYYLGSEQSCDALPESEIEETLAYYDTPNGEEKTFSHDKPRELVYGDKKSIWIATEEGKIVNEVYSTASNTVTIKKKKEENGLTEFEITAVNVESQNPVEKLIFVQKEAGDQNEVVGYANAYFKVNPREIDIDADNSSMTYSKIYDGDRKVFENSNSKDYIKLGSMPLKGVLNNDDVLVDLEAVSNINGELPEKFSLDTTTDEKTTITFEQSQLTLKGTKAHNYTLKEKTNVTIPATVTIMQRPVNIAVRNATRSFGHAYNNGINNSTDYAFSPEDWLEVQMGTGEGTAGIIEADYQDPDSSIALIEEQENGNAAIPETYPNALSVDTTQIPNYKNYVFTITKGTLTIVKEEISTNVKELSSYIALENSVDNTTMYFDSTKKLWVKSNVGTLKLSAKTDKLYDTVQLLEVDGQSVNVSLTDGYTFTDETKVGEVKLSLQLKNQDGATSVPFDYTIYLDNTIPEVQFSSVKEAEKTPLEALADKVTFGAFEKAKYTVQVDVSESVETSSGLKEWTYMVLPLNKDMILDSEKPDSELIAYIESLKDNGEYQWKPMITGNTATIPIESKKAEDENFVANNYVVLVKPYDNVTNSKIYTSLGIILDNNEPYVDLDLAAGEENKEVYDSDVQLHMTITDNNKPVDKTVSGLKEVYYQIAIGQDKLDDEKKEYLYQVEEGKRYTLDELQKEVLSRDITVKKEWNSNDIWVRVTAVDNSGNEFYAYKQLKIDIVDPKVTVKYETKATEDYAPYYKEDRTAVVTIKERNVDFNRSNELWFDLQREGEANSVRHTLSSLKAVEGITIDSVIDSEEGRDKTQYTDERTIEMRIRFHGDNKYNFDVHCTDTAGRANKEENGTYFVIDKTAPKLNVAYWNSDGAVGVAGSEDGRVYSGKPVTAKVEIEEHNFAYADKDVPIDVKVTANKVGAGEEIPDYAALEKTNSLDVWSNNVDVYTSTYTFNSDANYTHSITYTDLAGNTVSCGPGYFTVDKTQPTGTVEIKGFGFWESLLEKITFGLFSPSTVDVVMTGADHTSPVNPVQFARFHDQMTRDDLENYNGWSSASQEKPESAAFSVSPDEQFIVYTKVTDYAGNYQYFSSDGMIVDSTKPAPVVTITNLSQAQNGIFNENVTLQIDVEDPTAGETYSGLEKVWYTVSAAGNVTTSETIELLNNGGNKVQGNKTFSKVITVPADVYNSNDVKVQAFATDFSGNQGDGEITELKIDVTNPTISVSWDLNNPLNGRYYKDTRTATVTVTDRNFDPNNVRFSITNTDGTSANISGWSSSSNIGVSDTATSTCQVSFPADGDYTFTLGCTDLAGNSGEYGQTDEFTIDKTIPVMTVSYDNNNARNGNFFKETRTATVTIREHNFHAADVRAAITASLEGSGVSAPSISGFSGSGDVHTATVNYSTDGDYTFDIDYTDMAGNAAADYTQDSFTVDLTAPELEITDVEDKSANNDAVAPKVEATDVNYDAKGVTMTLTGANNGNVEVGKIVSAIQNGQSMKYNDFARTEEMDDLYKLQAKAVDKAGNETQKEIMFSVNRYGSVFILDNDTKDWLKTGDEGYTYIREEKEVGIREINVDAIESRSITVNRDGDLANLKENTDFTVKNSGSDAQWKEAHYVIAKNNFEEEGNYTVILNTQDKAQNSMNNTSVKKANKNLPIEFAVDKTAPTVVVSGVEDDTQYRAAERTMIVDAKDNLALTKVSISIDGEKTVYDGEELLKDNGVIETAVASANRWQSIEITAEDAAGNMPGQSEKALEGEPVVLRVLVTPNIVIQYYMNKPLFYGSIAAIVIMAGLIIFLVAKKKKGKNKNSKSMSSVG